MTENPYRGIERRRSPRHLAVVIVDSHCHIRASFWDGVRAEEARQRICRTETRLHQEVESLVCDFISETLATKTYTTRVVRLDEERTLRLSPLASDEGTSFALILEAQRRNDNIIRAAGRFSLTRRQTEVLGLVLQGSTAGEIAKSLSISEHTAQGYIKGLLSKTSSRNRSAMVAKVLEWEFAGTDDASSHAAPRLLRSVAGLHR